MAVSYWLTKPLRPLTLASLGLVHLQPEHPIICPYPEMQPGEQGEARVCLTGLSHRGSMVQGGGWG